MSEVLERKSRIVEVSDVSDSIKDGMTIAIGGFINSGHPMAIVRQLIKDGRRNLTVVGAASAGLETDMLIAAGCVKKVIAPYVGAEGLASIGPAFRKTGQDGTVAIFELDEAHFYAGLRASAQRLPFNPWRAGVGTSYAAVNPEIKEFTDPITGKPMLAIPAIKIDVALLHAAGADKYGNVQHNGHAYGDVAIYAASDKTFVSVEQVITNERVRANPGATTIPGATGIIRSQFGSHPFSTDGFYRPDVEHINEYLAAATEWLKTGSRDQLDAYFTRYIFEPKDHADYLERVGIRRLLSLHEF
jgi:glutaconate CoA-transferase, subunit A